MVLGASRAGRRAPAGPGSRHRGERGSQALELALVLPLVGLALVLVCQVALVGMDLVAAQGIAREAARAAAVEDAGAGAARAVAEAAAGRRAVEVRVSHVDRGLVLVEVRLESRALTPAGGVWLPARAVMRREGR